MKCSRTSHPFSLLCHPERLAFSASRRIRRTGSRRVETSKRNEEILFKRKNVHFEVTSLLTILIVIFIFTSCEDILEEPDLSTQRVNLLAPKDGSILNDNQATFNWEKIEDATAYQVQIATPNFENAAQFILDSIMAKDSLGNLPTRIDQALLNGNYQWRVKAKNTGFETPFARGGFAVDGDANVDLDPPNIPILESPADGTTQDETEVMFSWTREDISGSAERDSIYVFTDEDLQSLEIKGLGANKTFATTFTSNTYYWQVQAFDAAGNQSSLSSIFQLIIN